MLKVQELREIIRLIDDSSINEFTYETNGTKIKIKKNQEEQVNTKQEQVAVQAATVTEQKSLASADRVETAPLEEAIAKEAVEGAQETNYDHEIVSPMVGTFYQAPSPESEPYVALGTKVNEKTVVCIVEAMKLFNEIEAEVTGEIVEVLVKDGELVEYGQPLFRVKTT